MYIGKVMQGRMNRLGLTVSEVADKTFMDKRQVKAILEDEITIDDIDELDIALISSVLHCSPEFFSDVSVRKKDLLRVEESHGKDNEKSLEVKAKIRDFLDDFAFVKGVLSEEK